MILLLGCTGSGLLADEVIPEYKVKAAFLYNFTKFVEWPAVRTTEPGRPITIGVLGRNPFGDELANITRGRTVNGRSFAVSAVHTTEEAAAVDLLFVCAGEEARMKAMQESLHDAGVLTVGESPQFLAAGGVINFVIVGDKVRFAVNLAASERAGLKLSAQLLKLANNQPRKTQEAP